MMKITAISRNLLIVAVLALLVCCDTKFWHNIPVSHETLVAYGALILWFGIVLTVIALGLIVMAFVRHGRAPSHFVILACGVLLVISFAIFILLDSP